MPLKSVNKIAGFRVPNFACSIITASDELISVLVKGAVGQWKNVSLQCFEELKILLFFLLNF